MITIKLPNGVWSYEPRKPLGEPGGFGAVFIGKDASGKPVAIKKLHLDASHAAHRELNIAGVLAGHSFKNVMPILDAGQDAESENYFVIMPVAQKSLQDHLDKYGPLSEAEVVEILSQIASGLAEVPGIVHRDLKPANVLSWEESWRIADFGIARFVEESTSTETLKNCLSPFYAAPEQWKFEHATAATDMYALGCIGYALVSGVPPFNGTYDQLRDKHLYGTPPNLVQASNQLKILLKMMLRKEPGSRPSLVRIRQLLTQAKQGILKPPIDPGLLSLAAAAAEHESREMEAEAAVAKENTELAKRTALANEARKILLAIFDQLAETITKSIPNAFIRRESSMVIRVGDASLTLEVGSQNETIPIGAFPRSKWDVVCEGIAIVEQKSPPHKRSANLWYTKQADLSANYRWYEVGYQTHPFMERAFQFEPTAVSHDQADAAHWPGIDSVQVAYKPIPIDDEHAEQFCNRWIRVLSEACSSRLRQLPSDLG